MKFWLDPVGVKDLERITALRLHWAASLVCVTGHAVVVNHPHLRLRSATATATERGLAQSALKKDSIPELREFAEELF